MEREAAPQKGPEEWMASVGQARPPKDPGHFLLKPLKAVALGLIPLTPLTLVLMAFWPGTVDAEKRLCRSSCVSLTPSFSISHTLLLSLLLTPLSFLGPSMSTPPLQRPHPTLCTYTHTSLLYSLSILSVITGQCQHLKTVVLAEPVSSQVELTIFPVPDYTKPNSFEYFCALRQDQGLLTSIESMMYQSVFLLLYDYITKVKKKKKRMAQETQQQGNIILSL